MAQDPKPGKYDFLWEAQEPADEGGKYAFLWDTPEAAAPAQATTEAPRPGECLKALGVDGPAQGLGRVWGAATATGGAGGSLLVGRSGEVHRALGAVMALAFLG